MKSRKFCFITLLSMCLLLSACTNKQDTLQTETSELDAWVGDYGYLEVISDPVPMLMGFEISICEEESGYYADIRIVGQTTDVHAKARVYGDEEWISLVLEEYLPDNMIGLNAEPGSVLLSFRKEGEALYTYWGEIVPMIIDNDVSEKVYFEKDFDAIQETGENPQTFEEDMLNTTADEEITKQQVYDWLNTEAMYVQLYEEPLQGIYEQVLELDQSDSFVEQVCECEFIPRELSLAAEKCLYAISKENDYDERKAEFAKLASEVGSGDFLLSTEGLCELFPDMYETVFEDDYTAYNYFSENYVGDDWYNCIGIYRFMQEEKEYYLFQYALWNGPAQGLYVRLTERRGGEFVFVEEFETIADNGYVLECQDGFYYVALYYNFNLKSYDEMWIYSLNGSAETENIRIRYVPQNYKWTTVYENGTCENEAVWEAIARAQETLVSGNFIETGLVSEDFECLGGDEQLVDITNTEIPVHVQKQLLVPVVYGFYDRSTLRMDMYYSMEPSDDGTVWEIRELQYERMTESENLLVQMWFEEIGEKVYTFQVFYIDHYSYLLNVLLIEGDQVTRIGQTIATPDREFEFIEGTVFYHMDESEEL